MKCNLTDICAAVTAEFKLKPGEINEKSRRVAISRPRHIAWYLVRELTDMSYPDMGRRIGGYDHTTAIYGVERITQKLAEAEPGLALTLERIRNAIPRHIHARLGKHAPVAATCTEQFRDAA